MSRKGIILAKNWINGTEKSLEIIRADVVKEKTAINISREKIIDLDRQDDPASMW
jgi:hypothetical protein